MLMRVSHVGGACACLALVLLLLAGGPQFVLAQSEPAVEEAAGPSSQPAPEPVAGADASTIAAQAQEKKPDQLSLFWLLQRGGPLMYPIYGMSLVVVAFGIERFLGLRRVKVLPTELVDALGRLASAPGGFDPRKAYRLCQEHPSAAATVIRSMLLKVGRPHSEVEHAVSEASDREAARLYGNVGWLTLAAAVTPLMGLFGTVWGMILAFYDTSNLAAGANKADVLAYGIYTALVTTLGGLAVAIPAAILAHYFEGRIHNLFHQIDELLFNLLPQIERYEGRLRVSQQSLLESSGTPAPAPAKPASDVPAEKGSRPAAVTPK